METERGEARSAAMAAAAPGAGGPLVFSGSSQRDEALAKCFWNSVTLQPPLESRLAPRRESDGGGGGGSGSRKGSSSGASAGPRYSRADSREEGLAGRVAARLSGSRLVAFQGRQPPPPGLAGSSQGREEEEEEEEEEERLLEGTEAEKSDVKEQYLEKAKKRGEIIALLRKQREERIMKESISHLHKPKIKKQESFSKVKIPESDLEDQESVKALT